VDGDLTVTGAFTAGAGNAAVGGNLAVSGTSAVFLGGNLTVGGTVEFGGAFGNSAVAVATFYGATTITGTLTVGTGGLTLAGTGAAELTGAPAMGPTVLTVSNSGGVTLKAGIDVSTVAGGLTITGNGKVILPDTKAVTSCAPGTVKAGEWSIGTLAGTATGDIILATAGIKGAAAEAKLALADSGILVGLNGGAGIGATFDGVDIYLASGVATSVKIASGSTSGDATALTLANGAKISGLTGAGLTGTVAATTTTGDATSGITDIDAVTGTITVANAGNYLRIKSGKTNGTITATENGGAAKNYEIKIAMKATTNGA
jgi:hypothetical protein